MELISREDAIREISLLRLPDNDTNYCVKAHNDAIERSQEAVSQISVIESRPKGKWIYTSDRSGYIGNPVEQCSICGVEYEQAPFNYCPNCGSDMRGKGK